MSWGCVWGRGWFVNSKPFLFLNAWLWLWSIYLVIVTLLIYGNRSFDESTWGAFDNNDDVDSVWGFKTKVTLSIHSVKFCAVLDINGISRCYWVIILLGEVLLRLFLYWIDVWDRRWRSFFIVIFGMDFLAHLP